MRVYIAFARNDLEDTLLQLLDVQPNVSQRNSVTDPAGQTQYINWSGLSADVSVTNSGAGVFVMDNQLLTLGIDATVEAGAIGLAAYLIDNVENVGGGNISLTAAEANNIKDGILARVVGGEDLNLTDINTLINAEAGVSASGLATGASTASVEDILRILAGEVYLVPEDAAISGAANAFAAAAVGFFVTAPNVESADSVRSSGGFAVRGKSPFRGPFHRPAAPVQTGTESLLYREPRVLVEGGSVNMSDLSGNISKLKDTGFTWINPSFEYGAGGDAAFVDGTSIPTSGEGNAITVYLSDGTVL